MIHGENIYIFRGVIFVSNRYIPRKKNSIDIATQLREGDDIVPASISLTDV